MKAPELEASDAPVKLVEPDIERDPELGVEWLNGAAGHTTMRSMGNSEDVLIKILPTTLEVETKRIKDFITQENQLNWMITYEDSVVGSIWVDLDSSEDLPSPSVHIMIGDPNTRGKGVGTSAMGMVLSYLGKQGYDTIYSRHLTANIGADKLLKQFGFVNLGTPYSSDALEFQNLVKY